MPRRRFYGHILGLGSTSGIRCVIGHWSTSPLGSFSDVMVEDAAGHRTLLAPDETVADLVATTYTFDEVVLTPVRVVPPARAEMVRGPGLWRVRAAELQLDVTVGGRTWLGMALTAVPLPLAASPLFCRAVDPLASRLLAGVRTRGVARAGRQESYGALDLNRVTAASGSWRGQPIGSLARVQPPVRFGFSSTPADPSCVRVITTIDDVGAGGGGLGDRLTDRPTDP